MANNIHIRRTIPRYDNAGTVVDPNANGGIQGLGVEPVVSSTPGYAMPGSVSTPLLRAPALGGDPLGDQELASIGDEMNAFANRVSTGAAYSRGLGDASMGRAGTNETDVYSFASSPFMGSAGAEDIGSRFMRLGQSMGQIGTDQFRNMRTDAKVASLGSGIMAGVSGALGLARNIMSGVAAARGAARDERAAQERLARQRFESRIQYRQGGTYLGPGSQFDARSLTGEYLYPLPKSMEDQANVEVEKGEYVIQPGDTPSEALGEKHSKGGTKVSLDNGTIVISDSLKIGGEFASYIRDRYGMKVKPKDTYASLLDRYKSKIGLKSAYADQEKALAKLEENRKIKDANTRRLNESMLSKAINESNEDIAGMEKSFTAFAKMVYDAQEREKERDVESAYMAEGGEIDLALKKAQKEHNFSPEDMEELRKRIIKGIRRRQYMAEAGQVDNPYGRQLNFTWIANRYNNANNDFGYQRLRQDGYYGDVTDAWLAETARLYPTLGLTDTTLAGNDSNRLAGNIENTVNNSMNSYIDLAGTSLVRNAEDMRNRATWNMFAGQDSTPGGLSGTGRDSSSYPQNPENVYHSRSRDAKTGMYHLSRGIGSLDIVTKEQRDALNKAGITNFSQMFSDNNINKVREILGDDFAANERFREMYPDMDFVIGSYDPQMLTDIPQVNVDDIEDPTLAPVDIPRGQQTQGSEAIYTQAPVEEGRNRGRWYDDVAGMAMAFPEILRMTPTAVVTEGLERYRAPQVDPVLRSPDYYIAEQNRVLSSQLDQLESVPDSQRGAIMSNMQAIMGDNVARFINETEGANVAARTQARNQNAAYRKAADDQNIQERLRYQTGMLQGLAINEENWNRYYDSINQEAQQKWNARTSMNTLRSIFGDVAMDPYGRLIVTPQGDIVNPVVTYMRNVPDEDVRTTRSTTTTNDGRVRRTVVTRNEGR